MNYELIPMQQPRVGAAAPPDIFRQGRGALPVVPAPVCRIRVRSQDGNNVNTNHVPITNLTSTVRLLCYESPQGPPIDVTERLVNRPAVNPLRYRSASDPQDTFLILVFGEIFTREVGRYVLAVDLFFLDPRDSSHLATVETDAFDVVPHTEYPRGIQMETPLTRHLEDEYGLRLWTGVPPDPTLFIGLPNGTL